MIMVSSSLGSTGGPSGRDRQHPPARTGCTSGEPRIRGRSGLVGGGARSRRWSAWHPTNRRPRCGRRTGGSPRRSRRTGRSPLRRCWPVTGSRPVTRSVSRGGRCPRPVRRAEASATRNRPTSCGSCWACGTSRGLPRPWADRGARSPCSPPVPCAWRATRQPPPVGAETWSTARDRWSRSTVPLRWWSSPGRRPSWPPQGAAVAAADAVRAVCALPDDPDSARLLALAGGTAVNYASGTPGEEVIEEAATRAARWGLDDVVARADTTLGTLLAVRDPEAAAAAFDRARRAAERLEESEPLLLLRYYTNAGDALRAGGRADAAIALASSGLTWAVDQGFTDTAGAHLAGTLVEALLDAGRLEEASGVAAGLAAPGDGRPRTLVVDRTAGQVQPPAGRPGRGRSSPGRARRGHRPGSPARLRGPRDRGPAVRAGSWHPPGPSRGRPRDEHGAGHRRALPGDRARAADAGHLPAAGAGCGPGDGGGARPGLARPRGGGAPDRRGAVGRPAGGVGGPTRERRVRGRLGCRAHGDAPSGPVRLAGRVAPRRRPRLRARGSDGAGRHPGGRRSRAGRRCGRVRAGPRRAGGRAIPSAAAGQPGGAVAAGVRRGILEEDDLRAGG